MRQIRFTRPGDPAEVVRRVEAAEPTITKPGEVLVKVDLFPINPADLLTLRGFYPRGDPASSRLGVEATGIVHDVAEGVVGLSVGQRVLLLGGDLWSEFIVADQDDLVAVSPRLEPCRAACLKVNPATAMLLLREFVGLNPGDWVIQNAGNSAVGRAVTALAEYRGLRTLSVVRRPEILNTVKNGEVLLDSPRLAEQVAAVTGGTRPRLALDAVAGEATSRLIAACGDGATLVSYGAASAQAAPIDPAALVFRDLRVRGFWLSRWLAAATSAARRLLYQELAELAEPLDLIPPIDSVLPADSIRDAVTKATRIGAAGKVLVTFA